MAHPLAPPPLVVRGLKIDPPLFLAPMAGLTHTALRRIIAGFGGAGCLFTEMLSARSLRAEDPDRSPFLRKTPLERPLCYQVLASNPQEVAVAVEAVARFGADAVDLNFGCPAPLIRKRGGGSKLMESGSQAGGIVAAARAAAGGLPLSAKIRLGETLDEAHLKDFCRMLEEGGVDLIHVHARLRGEPYGRKPRWEWIGKVKGWVKVPVTGNGSVNSPEDALKCLELTGCDGLMIGRAAAERPWLFREIARELYGKPLERDKPDLPRVYGEFARLVTESFTPERRLGRLKEFTHYFAQNYTFGHTLAYAVQSARDFDEAVHRAEEFFKKNEEGFEGFER